MGDSNKGAFLTGFLFGGLAGAAAALLMTPQPGETTRLQIKDRGIELKTQFGDLTTGLQERGKVIIEEKLPSSSPASDQVTGPSALEDEAAGAEPDA
jgi:gas vesicle protein